MLVKCYKKLREDRTYVRGSAGVTVRQLESLLRLSEAIARVYLSDFIRAEHVKEAFELQVNTLRHAERESIDLGLEELQQAAGEAGAAEGEGEEGQDGDAARRQPKRLRISFADYTRIGSMLMRYLADQEVAGEEVKESDLISWYMEQIEDEIQTEEQLFQQQHLVQLIVNRMVDKDRVLVVVRTSEDPLRPEGRVLVKHPNVPVDTFGAR